MSTDKTDKRIEQMENDLKMLKNEIKLGMVSVHDYLLNMKTSTGNDLDTLGPDEETLMNLGGGLEMANKKDLPTVAPALDAPNGEKRPNPPVNEVQTQPKTSAPEANRVQPEKAHISSPPDNKPQVTKTESYKEPTDLQHECPDQSQIPYEGCRTLPVYTAQTPIVFKQDIQVNTLANLIGWVSAVKQRLGSDQLPVLLDVYDMCNELVPKTKKVILRLADLVTEQPLQESNADIWSQLILQLHGILMGSISVGGNNIQPGNNNKMALGEENKNSREDSQESPANGETPFKLKLVLPVEGSDSQEFDLGEFNIGDRAHGNGKREKVKK